MKKPITIWLLTFVLTFLSGLCFSISDSPIKKSEKLSDKAWEILYKCEAGKLPKKKIEKSQKLFEEAISLDRTNAHAFEGLGRVMSFKDNCASGLAYYDKAIDLSLQTSSCFNGRANCKKKLGMNKQALDDYFVALKMDPTDYAVRYNIGLIYFDQKEYGNALRFFGEALRLDDSYVPAYYWRGVTLKEMGQNQFAIRDMNEVLRRDSTDLDAQYKLAEIYLAQKKRAKSIQTYDKVIARSKNNGSAYYGKAYAEQDSGLYNEALANYHKYREFFPENSNVYNSIGLVYYKMGDTLKALEHYNKTLELDPKNYYAYWNRGLVYRDKERYTDAALDFASAIRLDSCNSDVYSDWALNYYYQKNIEKAFEYYAKANSCQREFPRSYYRRGLLYSELKQDQFALNDLDTVAALDSTYMDVNYQRAILLHTLGRRLESIAAYDKAIRQDKDCGFCYFGRGYVKQDSGMYKEALEDYEVCRKQYPQNSVVLNNIGNIRGAMGDTIGAIESYNTSLKFSPNDPSILVNRATIFQAQQKYVEAESDYYSAISADSTFAVAYSYLATLYNAQSQYAKALPFAEKGVKLDSNNHVLLFNLAIIKRDSGLYKESIKDFKTLHRRDPGSCKMSQDIAWCYVQLKDYKLSIAYYDSAIAVCKDNASLYNGRSVVYYHLKNFKAALKDLDLAIKLDSVFNDAYNSRGMIYYQTGNYKKAEEDFLASIRLDPTARYPFNNLANCYFKMNQVSNACVYWKKALDNGYIYQAEWKKEYGIDDPVELIKKHCK